MENHHSATIQKPPQRSTKRHTSPQPSGNLSTSVQTSVPKTARKKSVNEKPAVRSLASPLPVTHDILRTIPLKKSAITLAAQERAAEIQSSQECFDVLVKISAAEKYLAELKESIKSRAEEYVFAQTAKEIHVTETGVKYTFRSVTTWDFRHDAVHADLLQRISETKERVKKREEFLKTLTMPITENGVIVQPVRALETKTTLSLTLPA